MATSILWLIAGVLACMVSRSLAQLTGTITTPGNNGFIMTITITNPTASYYSVLKWNNVFDDQLELPAAFGATKEDGYGVQYYATTYALRSGMTDDDFHTLSPSGTPGATYTRTFDLRQYFEWPTSSYYNSPQTGTYDSPTGQPGPLKIILPGSFLAKEHTGDFRVPAEAKADLASKKLGKYEAADLTEVSLQSEPYDLTLNYPIFKQPISSDDLPKDGLQLDITEDSTCTGQNATNMGNAIGDAGFLTKSLLNGINNENTRSALFSNFFSGDAQLNNVLGATYQIRNVLEGNGPRVDAYCSDVLKLCKPNGNILGYSFTSTWIGNSYIVLCPDALQLGRAPEPCSQTEQQYSASASYAIFHLLMSINKVVSRVMRLDYLGTAESKELAGSKTADPSYNADSHAQLAIAAWAYGLGGEPYTGQSCLPEGGKIDQSLKRSLPSPGSHEAPSPLLSQRTEKSPATLSRRQEVFEQVTESEDKTSFVTGAGKCSGAQLALIQAAADNARQLASIAQATQDDTLWSQTFAGDETVRTDVKKVFEQISKWNTTGDDGQVTYYCDPQRASLGCRYNSGGFRALTVLDFDEYTASMLFCPTFFHLPVSRQCEAPLTTVSDNDQAGAVLRELLQVPWIVSEPDASDYTVIGDVDKNTCYSWDCVTAAAKNRDSADELPETSPRSYLYYALAARAGKADCSWQGYAGAVAGYDSVIS